MGLLPESSVDAISQQSYGGGMHYITDSYLDQGFFFWEDLAIKTYFAPGSRVLVASAGGGRELIALERAGYRADGFECSRAMVEAGRLALARRGLSATLDWSPPSVVLQMAGRFDAAIVGWNGYSYISPRARRIEFLRSLCAQLRPGSTVIVSTAIRTQWARMAVWTPRIANFTRRCTFREPVFEAGDRFEARPKKFFTKRQLEQELIDAGCSVKTFYVWGGYGAVVASVRNADYH